MTRLGIDIGGTSVKFGIVDENFSILDQTSIPTLANRPSEALIADIVAAAKPLIAAYQPATVALLTPMQVSSSVQVIFPFEMSLWQRSWKKPWSCPFIWKMTPTALSLRKSLPVSARAAGMR